MKRNFAPVDKKQHKRKEQEFRNFEEDYFNHKQPPKDNYKRKVKHRNNPYWETDY